MSPLLIRCANTRCENVVDEIGKLCPECQRREQMTEPQDLREKKKRIDAWNRHKNNKKKGGEE